MRLRYRLLALLLPVAALGCGGDDGNGPSGLTGTWSYSATQLTGGGIVCSVTTTVTLTQGSDGEFTGTAGGASGGNPSVSCTAQGGGNIPPGTATPFPFVGTFLGRITGSAVQFAGTTSDWVHGGTRAGNTITGSVRVTEPIPDGQRVLNGQFTMQKQ